jgi:hypothetical protein
MDDRIVNAAVVNCCANPPTINAGQKTHAAYLLHQAGEAGAIADHQAQHMGRTVVTGVDAVSVCAHQQGRSEMHR